MAEHRGIEERIQAAARARVAQQVGVLVSGCVCVCVSVCLSVCLSACPICVCVCHVRTYIRTPPRPHIYTHNPPNRWRPWRAPTRRARWRGCCTPSAPSPTGPTSSTWSPRSRRRSKLQRNSLPLSLPDSLCLSLSLRCEMGDEE